MTTTAVAGWRSAQICWRSHVSLISSRDSRETITSSTGCCPDKCTLSRVSMYTLRYVYCILLLGRIRPLRPSPTHVARGVVRWAVQKMNKPIEMLFGAYLSEAKKPCIRYGSRSPDRKGHFWGGHVPAYCKVQKLCKNGRAVAMRPFVKLLWTFVIFNPLIRLGAGVGFQFTRQTR